VAQPPPRRAALPRRAVVGRRQRPPNPPGIDQGSGLDSDSPAPALHALRIRCKQLRYLLDTTAPIHDPKPHERLVGALKKLQSALGE
jgi:CHAD domain-containing protein